MRNASKTDNTHPGSNASGRKGGRPRKGDLALGVRFNRYGWEARYKGEIHLGTRDNLLDAAALVKSEQARRLKSGRG